MNNNLILMTVDASHDNAVERLMFSSIQQRWMLKSIQAPRMVCVSEKSGYKLMSLTPTI